MPVYTEHALAITSRSFLEASGTHVDFPDLSLRSKKGRGSLCHLPDYTGYDALSR